MSDDDDAHSHFSAVELVSGEEVATSDLTPGILDGFVLTDATGASSTVVHSDGMALGESADHGDVPLAPATLLSHKLSNPDLVLCESDSFTLLTHCVRLGESNMDRIRGREAVVVLGNTGSGKSTLVNYLLGCEMIKKSRRSLGIPGLDEVVVVKSRAEGGPLDEFVPIGHGQRSQTFVPHIQPDLEYPGMVYCDCPGFLDNRGSEINIANAVNVRRLLQSARGVKVLLLVNYHSLLADRGTGVSDMLKICMQLFGGASQLRAYKSSILLGITKVPTGSADLLSFRNWLREDGSAMMSDLCDRMFLHDPLDGAGYLTRADLCAQLFHLPCIPPNATNELFRTVLTDRDKSHLHQLVKLQMQQMQIHFGMERYAAASIIWEDLKRFRVIDYDSINHMLDSNLNGLRLVLSAKSFRIMQAASHYRFDTAASGLSSLRAIASHFSSEDQSLLGLNMSELTEELSHFKSQKYQEDVKNALHAAHISDLNSKVSALEYSQDLDRARHRQEQARLRADYESRLCELASSHATAQVGFTSHLKSQEASHQSLSKQSRWIQTEVARMKLLRIAFGASAWREYFGVDVGEEPDLPVDIETILNDKAPFLLENESTPQCVGDNHLLTLIPGTVNGEAFTLDKLGELILRNHNGHFIAFQDNSKQALGAKSHGYRYCSPLLTEATRKTPLAGAPYWVLLPKTVLRSSRKKSFSDHKAMIAQYSSYGYQLPRVLEVATSLLVHYARSGGERLYANTNKKGWWTYTRCSDIDKSGDPLVVGGFGASGLVVSYDYLVSQFGVACSRKL